MRPTLILSGLFGRGNCGDEAILQVQYEQLAPHFELVISVDHQDAFDGFWHWYPYDRCRLVHTSNLAVFTEPDVCGLHVGGGGLPLGFNAAQVVAAASAGKPVFMTGTDLFPSDVPAFADAARRYLGYFRAIAPRNRVSLEFVESLGCRSSEGIDWACGLAMDETGDDTARGRTVVVLRELPESQVIDGYDAAVVQLLQGIKDQCGLPPVLLPFCPEDERFLESLPALAGRPVLRHWWNPRRVLRILADASQVISVGRLHPLIFSAMADTPAAYIEPRPRTVVDNAVSKVAVFARELGLPYFPSLAGGVRALSEGRLTPARARLSPPLCADRLARQVACIVAGCAAT